MWIVGGGLTVGVLGLSVMAGRARRGTPGAAPLDPQAQAKKAVADLPKTILAQHLIRIAMTGKALPKPDMDRAYSAAVALKLPKTALTVRSIATDGKPGGSNYSPLPLDENWPGTQESVRQFISNAMKALSAKAVA
jgi:hypothetical protein